MSLLRTDEQAGTYTFILLERDSLCRHRKIPASLSTEALIELIKKPGSQDFIRENLHRDPLKLLIKYSHDPIKKELSRQIAFRKKLAKKLPEWCSHPSILFPGGISSEQASSEATARLKTSLVKGRHLLDITGGLGIDSFYLSRSFRQATYAEQQAELAALARHNFEMLGADIEVKNCDGLEELARTDADLIYADPARRDGQNQKVIQLSDYRPDILPHLEDLVRNRTTLVKTSLF